MLPRLIASPAFYLTSSLSLSPSTSISISHDFIFYHAFQISFTIEQTPAGEFLPYSADFDVFRIFKLQLQMSLEFVSFFAIFGFLISYSWAELNQARHCKRITGSYTLYISGKPVTILEAFVLKLTVLTFDRYLEHYRGVYCFQYLWPCR